MTDIGTWYGQPIESLDKEELYKVINYLVKDIEALNKDKTLWREAADVSKYLKGKANAS